MLMSSSELPAPGRAAKPKTLLAWRLGQGVRVMLEEARQADESLIAKKIEGVLGVTNSGAIKCAAWIPLPAKMKENNWLQFFSVRAPRHFPIYQPLFEAYINGTAIPEISDREMELLPDAVKTTFGLAAPAIPEEKEEKKEPTLFEQVREAVLAIVGNKVEGRGRDLLAKTLGVAPAFLDSSMPSQDSPFFLPSPLDMLGRGWPQILFNVDAQRFLAHGKPILDYVLHQAQEFQASLDILALLKANGALKTKPASKKKKKPPVVREEIKTVAQEVVAPVILALPAGLPPKPAPELFSYPPIPMPPAVEVKKEPPVILALPAGAAPKPARATFSYPPIPLPPAVVETVEVAPPAPQPAAPAQEKKVAQPSGKGRATPAPNSKEAKEIGLAFKQIVNHHRKSLKEAAALFKMPYQSLSSLMNGKLIPSPDWMREHDIPKTLARFFAEGLALYGQPILDYAEGGRVFASVTHETRSEQFRAARPEPSFAAVQEVDEETVSTSLPPELQKTEAPLTPEEEGKLRIVKELCAIFDGSNLSVDALCAILNTSEASLRGILAGNTRCLLRKDLMLGRGWPEGLLKIDPKAFHGAPALRAYLGVELKAEPTRDERGRPTAWRAPKKLLDPDAGSDGRGEALSHEGWCREASTLIADTCAGVPDLSERLRSSFGEEAWTDISCGMPTVPVKAYVIALKEVCGRSRAFFPERIDDIRATAKRLLDQAPRFADDPA